jgi:hypothetical protein
MTGVFSRFTRELQFIGNHVIMGRVTGQFMGGQHRGQGNPRRVILQMNNADKQKPGALMAPGKKRGGRELDDSPLPR